MADNVLIPGAGAATAAADELTYSGDSAKIQLVRLVNVLGSEGSKTLQEIVAADGALYVRPMPNLFRIAVLSAGLTIATTAYTAGDQVGTLFTFADAARSSGKSGYVVGAELMDARDLIGTYDLVLFQESVTLAADNAAFSISAADTLKTVQVIPLIGAFDLGSGRIAQASNIRIAYNCIGGTSLYGALITRGGHNFFGAVNDLQVVLRVERE